jgi:hypothetical protein
MGSTQRTLTLLLVMALCAAAPPPGLRAAEEQKAPPRFFGIFATKVGAWSEYAVTEVEGGKKSTMRNAIVGKEGEGFWYEVAIADGGVTNIIRMYLLGDPNNPENIQRLIMKNGTQAAQEMPREFVVMGRRMATSMFESRSGSSVANQPDIKVEEVGTEKVTVPAGTVDVVKKRVLDASGKVLATFDFNKEILPFGVVRSETAKVKMELTGYGMDAKSQINETPVMMKTPPAMPEGNPRGKPPGTAVPSTATPAAGGYGAPAPASGGYGK